MERYLKESELLANIKKYCNPEGCTKITPKDVYITAVTTVECTQSADVEEVVRCKDCKWWYNEMDCRNTSGLYRFVPNGNWFCASGERK